MEFSFSIQGKTLKSSQSSLPLIKSLYESNSTYGDIECIIKKDGIKVKTVKLKDLFNEYG